MDQRLSIAAQLAGLDLDCTYFADRLDALRTKMTPEDMVEKKEEQN